MKRIVITMLALTMALTAIACSGLREGNGQDDYDETKSQLYVGTMGGGLGISWAEAWADKFEKDNEETVFEPGKKGVQVTVSTDKSYFNSNFIPLMHDKEHDIIITEQVNYYNLVRGGTAYDISEWVKEPLTEFGESKSIVDKLTEIDKEYYGQGIDQSYYALPFVNSIMAINYNIQLFEDRNWYFAADGEGDPDGFVWNPETPKSKGPDGRTGVIGGVDYSMDDGLPATYDDFFKLCDKIVDDGCLPFIWMGMEQQRKVTELLSSLVADIEGYEQTSLNYNFNGGTVTDLIDTVDSEGNITYMPETKITGENGYLLKRQKGNYYALKFLERLLMKTDALGNKKYYDPADSMVNSFTHTSAQAKFLQSRGAGQTPIAMMIDGSWWYNEASETFAYMAGTPGMDQYESRIGMMPLPKYSQDAVGDDTTWINQYITSVLVNGKLDESREMLVKKFFQYIHTDEALTSIIHDGHTVRPYTFDLVGYDEDDFSPFSLQHYKLVKNSKIVQPYSTHDLSKMYTGTIHLNYTTLTPSQYEYVTTAMYSNGVSAKQYFDGLATYMNKTRWDSMLTGGVR